MVAKPSDFEHGGWYALEALIWSGPLWLWLHLRSNAPNLPVQAARNSFFGLERPEAALAIAILFHFLSVALAGGDWMPAYRLVTPILPAMLRVACVLPRTRGKPLAVLGVLLAVTSMTNIARKLTPTARHVVERRHSLIRNAARALEGATVVAAPDVGWVGAAFDGDIVDLAGATDPDIAHLRGGHTSKRIDLRLLLSRRVDRVVVLLAPKEHLQPTWTKSRFAREIDYRAAALAAQMACVPSQELPIPDTQQSYVLLTCPSNPGL
jgi:hypothetical protein